MYIYVCLRARLRDPAFEGSQRFCSSTNEIPFTPSHLGKRASRRKPIRFAVCSSEHVGYGQFMRVLLLALLT